MQMTYLLAPIVGYLVAGSLKFLINSIKTRQLAFKAIGLGGMPSTHNTITATVATLIALREGVNSPIFSVAACLVIIVAIDSMGLRKHIESHAKILKIKFPDHQIRQKIGHTPFEVTAGILLGFICGFMLARFGF